MDWLALFTLLQSAFGLAHLLVHRCPCHCLQKQLQVNNQSVWCDIRLSCKNVILLLLNSLLPSKSTTDYQNAISVVYNVMSLVKHILVWTTIVVALEVYEATVLVLLLDYLTLHKIMQLVVFV